MEKTAERIEARVQNVKLNLKSSVNMLHERDDTHGIALPKGAKGDFTQQKYPRRRPAASAGAWLGTLVGTRPDVTATRRAFGDGAPV